MFAVQADGHAVETVEGLAAGDDRCIRCSRRSTRPTRLQCGFCTPGILMTLVPFLRDHPAPAEAEIREALSGHLCRCTGYANIVAAVQRAVATGRGTTRRARR